MDAVLFQVGSLEKVRRLIDRQLIAAWGVSVDIDKVYIDGFKNLKQLEVDFDESKLTTVLIGQNGAGKSNLIEAITQVFRWVDLRRNEPRFHYRVDYRIQPPGKLVPQPPRVTLSNVPGEPAIRLNGKEVKRTEFEKHKQQWFAEAASHALASGGWESRSSRRLATLVAQPGKDTTGRTGGGRSMARPASPFFG